MESSWAGNGGFLPTAATLFGAVLSMAHRQIPQDSELPPEEQIASKLSSEGPFLCKNNEVYFPTPLDVLPGNNLLELKKLTGHSDLPVPLQYALFAGEPSKAKVDPFISFSEMKKYLSGEKFKLNAETEFLVRETRPGITISPVTRTAEKHKNYFAEYLRLRDEVALAAKVELDNSEKLAQFFPAGNNVLMQLGGQQTLVYAKPFTTDFIPQVHINGKFVKWVLLTPAAWLKGWLPDFVDEQDQGKVLLKIHDGSKPERQPGELRADYRKRVSESCQPIAARLIAARVGKAVAISGWKNQGTGGGNAKASRLYVPAGSVYYFEAQDEKEAQKLVKAIHGRSLSTFSGRAGFGLGVCGNFTINNNNQ